MGGRRSERAIERKDKVKEQDRKRVRERELEIEMERTKRSHWYLSFSMIGAESISGSERG